MSPKSTSLRERNKEEKLARIEKAARALFSQHGYDRTTTRQIAKKAGIGVGTLFVYFPEKRDLLMHLFTSDVAAVKDDAFAEIPKGSLVDRVMFVFERFFDYYARDPALSKVFVKELAWVSDNDRIETNTFVLELMMSLAQLVIDAQHDGEVDRSVVPLAAAYQLFGAYFTSLVGWLGGLMPDRESQLAMLRAGVNLLYHGLRVRPTGSD